MILPKQSDQSRKIVWLPIGMPGRIRLKYALYLLDYKWWLTGSVKPCVKISEGKEGKP